MTTKELFRDIRRIQIKTLREVQDLFAGAYHSAFKGQGLTFEDVREYFPGDEVRHIDWNVTARMQQPFVKSFREERELTVLLVVDISASSLFSSSSRLKSEIIAEIGALLAFSAIKNQDKIGLILFSSEVELYLPAKKTLRSVLRVIRELLYYQPRHKGTDLKEALAFLGKVQRKRCVCFLISDFLTPKFGHDIDLIAKKHDLIAIRVTDPHEQHFPDLGLVQLKDLESGKNLLVDTSNSLVKKKFSTSAEMQTLAFRQAIQRSGSDLIEIDTHQSYIEPLRHFFKVRSRRR